jgi:hypothetical protein
MKSLRLPVFILLCFLASAHSTSLTAQTTANSDASTAAPPATAQTAAAPTPQDTILEYSPPPAEYARAKAYSKARYRHFFITSL